MDNSSTCGSAAWSLHRRRAIPPPRTGSRSRPRRSWPATARRVAAEIPPRPTPPGYTAAERAGADECARYLEQARLLDYDQALAAGWPIATGVIEGACRHLVADRLDITGARWGLDGAEAVLKLSALISNGDFDEYWQFHLDREHQRLYPGIKQGQYALGA